MKVLLAPRGRDPAAPGLQTLILLPPQRAILFLKAPSVRLQSSGMPAMSVCFSVTSHLIEPLASPARWVFQFDIFHFALIESANTVQALFWVQGYDGESKAKSLPLWS